MEMLGLDEYKGTQVDGLKEYEFNDKKTAICDIEEYHNLLAIIESDNSEDEKANMYKNLCRFQKKRLLGVSLKKNLRESTKKLVKLVLLERLKSDFRSAKGEYFPEHQFAKREEEHFAKPENQSRLSS